MATFSLSLMILLAVILLAYKWDFKHKEKLRQRASTMSIEQLEDEIDWQDGDSSVFAEELERRRSPQIGYKGQWPTPDWWKEQQK